MVEQYHFVLIGAGNVGSQLGKRLQECGLKVIQVYSRRKEAAQRLAAQIGSEWTTELSATDPTANMYILAVPDDAIADVAHSLSRVLHEQAVVVHTSGATPSSVLAPYFSRYGVFYPLQTFSRNRPVDFDAIPLCCYAPDPPTEHKLKEFGQLIGKKIFRVDDEQRGVLHVAAVFVNNFSNHLFHIGQQILEKEGLPFELLQPLILETALKVQDELPWKMQTGPAARADRQTIARHVYYLQQYPAWQELYQLISGNIGRTGSDFKDH